MPPLPPPKNEPPWPIILRYRLLLYSASGIMAPRTTRSDNGNGRSMVAASAMPK